METKTPDLSDLTINLIFDSVRTTAPDMPELQICKKVDNGNLLIDVQPDGAVGHVSIPRDPSPYGDRTQHIWVPNNAPLDGHEQALFNKFDVQNIADSVMKAIVNNEIRPHCDPWCTPEHSEFAAVKSLIEKCEMSIGGGLENDSIQFQYQCSEVFVDVEVTKQSFTVTIESPNDYELFAYLTRKNPLDEWIMTQIFPRHTVADIKKMYADIMS